MTSMVSVMPNQVPEAMEGAAKMMLYLGYGPFPGCQWQIKDL